MYSFEKYYFPFLCLLVLTYWARLNRGYKDNLKGVHIKIGEMSHCLCIRFWYRIAEMRRNYFQLKRLENWHILNPKKCRILMGKDWKLTKDENHLNRGTKLGNWRPCSVHMPWSAVAGPQSWCVRRSSGGEGVGAKPERVSIAGTDSGRCEEPETFEHRNDVILVTP